MEAVKEVIHAGPIEIRFLLPAAQTAGTLTMFEFLVPQGARVPVPHSHEAFDETIYGLDGTLTWVLDGRTVRVGPGEVLFIPAGAVHAVKNTGSGNAAELATYIVEKGKPLLVPTK